MEPVSDSSAYDVSPLNGFLPEKAPLDQLCPYFKPWDELAGSLPQLVKCGKRIRDVVHELPLLDHTRLETREEYVRAHIVLSAISHVYVWCKGEDGAAKVLPKCLAVPWARISDHLGILPVLSYCTLPLSNWKIVDKERPLNMDNMEILVSLTGSSTEDAFFKVTLQIELDAVAGLQAILKAQEAVVERNEAVISSSLDTISKTILQMTKSLLRLFDICDPREFYSTLRLYLSGWKDSKQIPGGLLYEGVSSYPFQFSGGTGAQSPTFQVLDAALGIEHPRAQASDKEPPVLERMRSYMLPRHREFITAVRNGPSIKQFVQASKNEELIAKFDNCVEMLKGYRNSHINIVAKFVIIQATKGSRIQSSSRKVGTGGSGVMPFLKKVRNETRGLKAPPMQSHQLVDRINNNNKIHAGDEMKTKMREPEVWKNFIAIPTLILLYSAFIWILFAS